jgi:hypothetical protein
VANEKIVCPVDGTMPDISFNTCGASGNRVKQWDTAPVILMRMYWKWYDVAREVCRPFGECRCWRTRKTPMTYQSIDARAKAKMSQLSGDIDKE